MKRLTLIAGAMLVAATVLGSGKLPPGEYAREFKADDGTTQPYRLFVPSCAAQTTQALPLVVVLHGWGVDEHAWFKFTPVKRVAEQFGYVVAAPYGRGNWWYRGPAEQDVLATIADVRTCVRIDSRRIYLAGHSMGGWGTWFIGLRHPDVFAAIAPMAGFDPGELAGAAVALRPYVVHDAVDPIVPVAQSRRPVELMARSGITHVYHEEIGYGHASRMIGDHLERVFEWFRQHPRESRPRRLALASYLGGQRDRWLALLAPATWPQLALVDAFVDAQGTVDVSTRNVKAFALCVDDLPASATKPLRCRVDSQEITTSASAGWVILTRGKGKAGWKCLAQSDLPSPEPPPPLRGPIAEQLVKAHADDQLATTVATILMRHFGTDGCVLDADKVRVAKGPLTAQKLLDAWIYPEGRLVRLRLTPAKLATAGEVISKGRALVVPADLAASRQKLVEVVMPLALAGQFVAPADIPQPTGYTIGELLAALATGVPLKP